MSIINTLDKDTHYFTLDLHDGAILAEPLKFKQYDDESRVLAIELTVHNVGLGLTDSRVDIWVYKKDGTLVQKAVNKADIDIENSTVMIPLTRQMLAVTPSIECEITVTSTKGTVLSFPIFEIEIEESNIDTSIVVSTSEFDLFYDAIVEMQKYVRDYLHQYDVIDRAFKTKLDAIEQEKIRIANEITKLSEQLVKDDGVRWNNLKELTVGEFAEWFKQAKASFALAGREIETRFNILANKMDSIHTQSETIMKDIEKNQTIVHDLVADIREKLKEFIAKYEEMKALYEDAQLKFAEMKTTFEIDQAERKQAFDNAQTQRATDFTNAQAQRATEFNESQIERTNAYTEAENTRNTNYQNAEKSRTASYETAEQTRTTLFNAKEEERKTTFDTNENNRQTTFEAAEVVRNNNETTRMANEDERLLNEATRVSEFNEMKETFNTFINYRIIEE